MKRRLTVITLSLAVGLWSASCLQQPPAAPTAPSPPAASDVHRYQIIVASEGDKGSVLFLLDTKEGATWLYRPPQGSAVNGFWSDIPRITYPPDFWQRAFSQLGSAPSPAATGAPPAAASAAPARSGLPDSR
jgi:hypothetical protein